MQDKLIDKECLTYSVSEFKDLIDALKGGNDSLVHSYGCKLNDVVENYLSKETTELVYTRESRLHHYLLNDNLKRFGAIFLMPRSILPTLINDNDPVVMAVVLWRIRSKK